jgi:hypothetical protein
MRRDEYRMERHHPLPPWLLLSPVTYGIIEKNAESDKFSGGLE